MEPATGTAGTVSGPLSNGITARFIRSGGGAELAEHLDGDTAALPGSVPMYSWLSASDSRSASSSTFWHVG